MPRQIRDFGTPQTPTGGKEGDGFKDTRFARTILARQNDRPVIRFEPQARETAKLCQVQLRQK